MRACDQGQLGVYRVRDEWDGAKEEKARYDSSTWTCVRLSLSCLLVMDHVAHNVYDMPMPIPMLCMRVDMDILLSCSRDRCDSTALARNHHVIAKMQPVFEHWRYKQPEMTVVWSIIFL